jgi:hypothetical protein
MRDTLARKAAEPTTAKMAGEMDKISCPIVWLKRADTSRAEMMMNTVTIKASRVAHISLI